ncbi:MAG: alpha-L-rhamnosidase [Sedimentisphaeraceae bacterium JB056]
MKKWFAENVEFDRRKNYYIPATRIVKTFGSNCQSAKLLENGNFILKKTSDEEAGLILDFGQELNGGIRIKTGHPRGEWFAKIRVRFGESVSEVLTDPVNDHAIHDQLMTISALGTHDFGDTGFRFVRIDFLDDNIEFDIQGICAIAKELELEYKGSFECSDELLNKIWITGARTVHLCCQNYIFDGIKRDRLLWVGDLHPQIQVAKTVFGDIDVVRKTITASPATKLHTPWMNWGFASYSLWWIICLWEWYHYTSDKQLLTQAEADIDFIINEVNKFIDQQGNEHYEGHRFIDWPTAKNESAINQGLLLLTSMATEKVKTIATILSNNDLAQKAAAINNRLNKTKLQQVSDSKQINALKAFAGIDSPIKKQAISSQGLSTWYGYYYIQHLASCGFIKEAMELIKQYWGGMLSLGATTFWEHFDLAWLENASRIDEPPTKDKVDIHAKYGGFCFTGHRHSLCHGWASGPTAWLSQYVLGFNFNSPGCKDMDIKPNLGDLEWAKGTFPTPNGIISVEHKKTANGIESKIDC